LQPALEGAGKDIEGLGLRLRERDKEAVDNLNKRKKK
jgi:hypothetical protein